MRLLFLPGTYNSPSSRFRLWQFVHPLTSLGHGVSVRVAMPERTWISRSTQRIKRNIDNRIGTLTRIIHLLYLLRDAEKFDAIFVHRDLVPEVGIRFLEPWLANKNPRIIFDFDDSIHLGAREAKLRQILPQFAWITPGNEYLAAFARQLHARVTICPTVVNTNHYQLVQERVPGPLRIGWSGSRSTIAYCLPILKEVMRKLSKLEEFEFLVIADTNPEIKWDGVKTRFLKWTPKTEVSGLQQIDIGLMPLKDEPFERGKCGLKAIQYMGVGVPALVSPVGVNQQIVLHGETGYHCNNNDEWIACLRTLLHDEKLRKRMGERARDRIVSHYSVDSLLPTIVNISESIQGQA